MRCPLVCIWHVSVIEQRAFRDKISMCLDLALRTAKSRTEGILGNDGMDGCRDYMSQM